MRDQPSFEGFEEDANDSLSQAIRADAEYKKRRAWVSFHRFEYVDRDLAQRAEERRGMETP